MKKNKNTATIHRSHSNKQVQKHYVNSEQKRRNAQAKAKRGKILLELWNTRYFKDQFAFKMSVSDYITLQVKLIQAVGGNPGIYHNTFQFLTNPPVRFQHERIQGFSKSIHPFVISARITDKEVTIYLNVEAIRKWQKQKPFRLIQGFVSFINEMIEILQK